jgi:hypothetical protein
MFMGISLQHIGLLPHFSPKKRVLLKTKEVCSNPLHDLNELQERALASSADISPCLGKKFAQVLTRSQKSRNWDLWQKGGFRDEQKAILPGFCGTRTLVGCLCLGSLLFQLQ